MKAIMYIGSFALGYTATSLYGITGLVTSTAIAYAIGYIYDYKIRQFD